MTLTANLIAAVSIAVQASPTLPSDQWDKCEEIRKCDLNVETGFSADCWMSTVQEIFSDGEPSGRWVGNIQYTKIRNHPRFNTNSAIWLVIDHFDGSFIDDECVEFDGRINCWRAIGKGRDLFKLLRGMDYRSTQLNTGEIRWSAEFGKGTEFKDGSMIADRFIICDADVHSFDVTEPKPTPAPTPSGQWDKCEEIELCSTSTMDLMLQPAGWTSTDMNYNRVACFYQATVGESFVGIRQSEFEKVERFNTNSAIWIVVEDSFKKDTIADQCEINQEEGCWRAIGKGEKLYKVMRGMSYTTTKLDTAKITVEGMANRMIICDADLHSFDVDEPEPEKPNPTLPNRYCHNTMMWHNSAGEPTQRWTLSAEKFTDLRPYVDSEKIYEDGNGNYLWWTWIAWTGRWFITK